MTDRHLTPEQRTEINQNKGKIRPMEIAKLIGKHISTIYRELKRNALELGKYCPLNAQKLADARKAIPRRPTKDTEENRAFLEAMLGQDRSPDNIAGRLKREAMLAKEAGTEPPEQEVMGTSCIYNIIARDRKNKGELFKLMPRRGKKYQKKQTSEGRTKRGKLPVKPEQNLPNRPVSLAFRKVPGHFEVDLMFSGETVWLTLVDRCSRKTIVRAMESKESEALAAELFNICQTERIRTMTFDRGQEWAKINSGVVDLVDAKLSIYFCAPYRSWEKGSIENLNRLLRRYFPKGENLTWNEDRKREAREVAEKMNNRPRKILGYRTPLEVEQEWSNKALKEQWQAMMIPPLAAA
jgi:IS30 family transposase